MAESLVGVRTRAVLDKKYVKFGADFQILELCGID